MMSDMRTPIMVGSDKATQHILAPTQNDLVAKQDYDEGALFIFNNGLYKTTAAIITGDNIVIGSGTGTNAEPSDKTVVEEIGNRKLTKAASFIASSTSVTYRQAMNGLRTAIGGGDVLKQIADEHWDTLCLKTPASLFKFASFAESSNNIYIVLSGLLGFSSVSIYLFQFCQNDSSNNIFKVSANGAAPTDSSTTAISSVHVGEWAIYY